MDLFYGHGYDLDPSFFQLHFHHLSIAADVARKWPTAQHKDGQVVDSSSRLSEALIWM